MNGNAYGKIFFMYSVSFQVSPAKHRQFFTFRKLLPLKIKLFSPGLSLQKLVSCRKFPHSFSQVRAPTSSLLLVIKSVYMVGKLPSLLIVKEHASSPLASEAGTVLLQGCQTHPALRARCIHSMRPVHGPNQAGKLALCVLHAAHMLNAA